MGMHKGIEYDFVGTNGTIFFNGHIYSVAKREGCSLDECARKDIEALLNDRSNSIRPKVTNKFTDCADDILDDLRGRKGVLDGIADDVLDEIHEEVRTTLVRHFSNQRL